MNANCYLHLLYEGYLLPEPVEGNANCYLLLLNECYLLPEAVE